MPVYEIWSKHQTSKAEFLYLIKPNSSDIGFLKCDSTTKQLRINSALCEVVGEVVVAGSMCIRWLLNTTCFEPESYDGVEENETKTIKVEPKY